MDQELWSYISPVEEAENSWHSDVHIPCPERFASLMTTMLSLLDGKIIHAFHFLGWMFLFTDMENWVIDFY